jgi:hypothetical protein
MEKEYIEKQNSAGSKNSQGSGPAGRGGSGRVESIDRASERARAREFFDDFRILQHHGHWNRATTGSVEHIPVVQIQLEKA